MLSLDEIKALMAEGGAVAGSWASTLEEARAAEVNRHLAALVAEVERLRGEPRWHDEVAAKDALVTLVAEARRTYGDYTEEAFGKRDDLRAAVAAAESLLMIEWESTSGTYRSAGPTTPRGPAPSADAASPSAPPPPPAGP